LQWSAVAGSVLLAALFLAYRAGAFNTRTGSPPADPAATDSASQPPPATSVADPKIMMSGSKSLAPISFVPSQPPDPVPQGPATPSPAPATPNAP
jgi:hypothetical protein